MTKIFACALVVVTISAGPAFGQLAAKEMEIRRAVPYTTLLRDNPSMTLTEYNAAVRAVAQNELGTAARMGATQAPAPAGRYPVYVPPTAPRSSTASRIATTTFTTFDDGTSATTNRIGSTSFTNFSDGTSATTNRIGPTAFTNLSTGTSATTNRIGPSTFTNFSNGTTATTNKIGSTSFTTFSNGKTCTTTKIGTTSYTNCY